MDETFDLKQARALADHHDKVGQASSPMYSSIALREMLATSSRWLRTACDDHARLTQQLARREELLDSMETEREMIDSVAASLKAAIDEMRRERDALIAALDAERATVAKLRDALKLAINYADPRQFMSNHDEQKINAALKEIEDGNS